jgi:uncharacterized protein YndB with AHSA1/START domain
VATVAAKPASERILHFTRVFDAPRELVFKAWTDPKHLRHWWGPKNFPADELSMEVRPGGRWRHRLRSTENGDELWHGGVFREVVPPERLVFTFAWDEDGMRGHETIVTVTFAEQNGKTLMTFHHELFRSVEERDGHMGGWTSTFDRLAEHLVDWSGSQS